MVSRWFFILMLALGPAGLAWANTCPGSMSEGACCCGEDEVADCCTDSICATPESTLPTLPPATAAAPILPPALPVGPWLYLLPEPDTHTASLRASTLWAASGPMFPGGVVQPALGIWLI